MDRTDEDRATSGAALIEAERQRQIEVEGYTPAHDAEHNSSELIAAAWVYLGDLAGSWPEWLGPPNGWPWRAEDWKPTPNDPVRQLVKVGALIAAEIDRRLGGGA